MSAPNASNLFTDFLGCLGVPFTHDYSVERFNNMPFKTLFGLSKLLDEYGIDNEGISLDNPADIAKLPTPFLAHTHEGVVIVTAFSNNEMEYLSQGVHEKMPIADFTAIWGGKALIAKPKSAACEPEYSTHRRNIALGNAKNILLCTCVAAMFLYLFISNGLWKQWSTYAIAIFDMAGLYFSWLLVGKSMNLKSRAADTMCRILQDGGCDTVLKTSASKFFGIFSWSEVGLTYFSVSLLTLLVFPHYTTYLAALNVCCLPFTVWSIWYQHFRAKAWCTLCVSVQATLWALFFCYLGGGWLRHVFPLHIELFALGLTYLTVLLTLNKLSTFINPTKE